MDVEIVLDQDDGPCAGEMEIGQVFQDMGVIHGGVAIGHFDMTPAFERREHHEQIGGPIALVFVIETGRAPGFHRDRRACLGNELLRGLVQANQRAIRIVGPRVDSQHVFHRRYERAVGLGRDDPALAAMGLENVFLSARPIVELLARSTISSSTTFSSNKRKVQRARPLGGCEQARAISLASFSPSNIRGTAGATRCFRLSAASKPSLHKLLANPVNHRWAGFQGLNDPAVAPGFAGVRNIGLQQYPRFHQLPGWAFPLPQHHLEPLALFAAQPHDIFLYRNLLRSHDRLLRPRRRGKRITKSFQFD